MLIGRSRSHPRDAAGPGQEPRLGGGEGRRHLRAERRAEDLAGLASSPEGMSTARTGFAARAMALEEGAVGRGERTVEPVPKSASTHEPARSTAPRPRRRSSPSRRTDAGAEERREVDRGIRAGTHRVAASDEVDGAGDSPIVQVARDDEPVASVVPRTGEDEHRLAPSAGADAPATRLAEPPPAFSMRTSPGMPSRSMLRRSRSLTVARESTSICSFMGRIPRLRGLVRAPRASPGAS